MIGGEGYEIGAVGAVVVCLEPCVFSGRVHDDFLSMLYDQCIIGSC